MPGIPHQWFDGIVYTYQSEVDARAGAPYGATGFLMSLDPSRGLPPAAGHLYVVTNAHVAEGGCDWLRFNDHHGGIEVRHVDRWFLHPDGDDIALAPVGAAIDNLRTATVPFEMAVTPELFQDSQGLSPGDEAFFIGRFINRDGRSSNTPTARFGVIAQVGGDPIVQKERGGFRQDSFLVECHSLSGFSGSPVFAYRSAHIRVGTDIKDFLGRDDPNLWIQPQYARVYLLGVDWGSDPWAADVRDKTTDRAVRNEYVRASSGMAMVVPAWKLRGALDHPDLVDARQQREDAWCAVLAQQDPVVMDVKTPGPPSGAEMVATADPKGKLLQVPVSTDTTGRHG